MRTVYNILFTIGFVVSAPYYFLKLWRRGHWRSGFYQRFGHYRTHTKHAITNRHTLWLHAVSVGEVNLCTQLIRALEPRVPNLKIIVSTTTTTGMGQLRHRLPSHIEKIYYPVDRRKCVQRALTTLHPEAIVLVEAEIWPNFLWQAHHRGIPLFLVNARLSDRSYRGYKRCRFLFGSIFASFTGVGAQDEADAAKLRELGCRPEAIRVLGNLKYDAVQVDERRLLDVPALLRQLAVPEGAPLLVAGSTHAGEEAVLAEQFLRLRRRFPELFLVLVPRHFERGKEIGVELTARGVKFAYRSEVSISRRFEPGEVQCLLVNTTGELKYFYEYATVVFVGKSLTAEGGQSPIEPGALGRAMVFGPNMQNFAAIGRALVDRRGAVQVRHAAELEQVIGDLLGDPHRREELGRNARTVIRENQGAIERTVAMLLEHLPQDEHYVKH
ncbi:MAG: 3-deoxy-D-manno-octulosonic acid transferase [Verrucomicrobia bacterium]|nr:3-deoxy-D-manno-octulosonic acid transferase [Verrucomicrobiota bacterium]